MRIEIGIKKEMSAKLKRIGGRMFEPISIEILFTSGKWEHTITVASFVMESCADIFICVIGFVFFCILR